MPKYISEELKVKLFAEQYDQINFTPEIINGRVRTALNTINTTVAHTLTLTPQGLEKLKENDFALANMISAETFQESLIPGSERIEHRLAYELSKTTTGRMILAANNFRLANLISQEELNKIVEPISETAIPSSSIVYYLSKDAIGLSILEANDFALANKINANTLNRCLRTNDEIDTTPAYWLSESDRGHRILLANNGLLGRMITAGCLTLKTKVNGAPRTILSNLLNTKAGRQIMCANEFALVRKIPFIKYNHIVTIQGISMPLIAALAFIDTKILFVSHSDSGVLICRFLTSDTLNYVMTNGDQIGLSIASKLALIPQGLELLLANDCTLLLLISSVRFFEIIAMIDADRTKLSVELKNAITIYIHKNLDKIIGPTSHTNVTDLMKLIMFLKNTQIEVDADSMDQMVLACKAKHTETTRQLLMFNDIISSLARAAIERQTSDAIETNPTDASPVNTQAPTSEPNVKRQRRHSI